MKVTVTGATGRVGAALVAALQARGDTVTVLSRDADRARRQLGDVEAHAWRLKDEPAPVAALEGRDAVVHLAGEDVGQRWSGGVKEEILASRELGTRNLVAGMKAAQDGPKLLVSASASGFYGPRDSAPVDESAAPGRDFLADVCVRWEREADAASAFGVRVIKLRTGVVLDAGGGALATMLLPFKLGIGGPVAGGRQYMPWIQRDDIVGLYVAALDSPGFSGPVNGAAPEPVTNKAFSKALGKALKRPAFSPVPGFMVKLLFGEMATIVVGGVNMVPGRAGELGYTFRHTEILPALRYTLGK